MSFLNAGFAKLCFAITLFTLFSNDSKAQTTLVKGDIAFTGYYSNGVAPSLNDQFSFVLLTGITNNTVINFTDNGWLRTSPTTGSFRTGEGTVTYTSNGAYAAGTEILITITSGTTATATLVGGASAGTATGSVMPNFSANGDQVIAYQGTSAAPTFISAIHMNVYSVASIPPDIPGGDGVTTTTTEWDGAENTANASGLPALGGSNFLTNGTDAIWIPGSIIAEKDNARFNGCALPMGNAAAARAALNNVANWITNNDDPSVGPPAFGTLPTGCSYITALPAPSFTTNPSSATICENANTTFTVAATGATGYQWQVDNGGGFANITNNAIYSGATTTSLTITGATASMNGYLYRAVASNGSGSTNSTSATLTVTALPVNPTLLAKTPATIIVADGTNVSATFNAGSGGTGCADDYRYTTNGGATYLPYTPGTNISTTGLAAGSGYVFIEGRRANCSSSCQNSYVVLASWQVSPLPGGATTLAAGDIAFSGYIGGNNIAADEFSFVLLKNMGAGTAINFTSTGWLSTNVFGTAEETVTWTVPAGGLAAGTEIRIAGTTATRSGGGAAGTVTGTALTFSVNGDQVLAYTGSSASPTFISGIHMNVYSTGNGDPVTTSAASWDGAATGINASALPTGLTTGTNAIWIGVSGDINTEFDNAKFGNCNNPAVPGSISALRAALNNRLNWITSNGGDPASFSLPTGCNYLSTLCPTITVTNPATATGVAGTAFSQTFTSAGGVPTVTYSTTSTLPTGLTLSSAGVLSGTPTQTGSFPIVVVATDGGGCTGTGSTYTLVISCPAVSTPTITPGGPTTFCTGGSVILTSSAATNNQWYVGGNPIGGATNQTYTATASGSYTVVQTSPYAGCNSSPSAAVVVTVNTTPATPTITPGGPTTFCAGGSVTLTSSAASGNQWYVGGNPIGGATNQTYSATASGVYTVVVTASGCSSAPSSGTTVTVTSLPSTPTVTPGGPTTFCSGGSVVLTSSSASGNQWYVGGNPIGGATNQTYTATASGTYTVVVTASGCSSAPSAGTVVTVNAIPVVTASPSAQIICSGSAISTIVLSSSVGGTTYNWTRDNTATVTGIASSGTTDISGTLTNTTNAPVTVTFTITSSANSCAGAPVTATVTVNPIPDVVKPGDQALCNGQSTAAVTFSGTMAGTTYNWTNSDPSIGLAASGTGNISSFTATNTTNAPVTATITVTPTISSGSAAPVPELLYYKFDGTGNTVPNLASAPPAGTATATLLGSLTQGGNGICNGTLIGTGNSSVSDYVHTGWQTMLPGVSWTVSFKTANIASSSLLYYVFGDINAGEFRCFTNGVAGPNNWILRGNGIVDVTVNGGATVAEHTTTFVYDNTTNIIKGYLDGVLVTTVPQVAPYLVGTGPFKVGGYATNTGLSAGGLMDEFRLYDRALTDAEVATLAACNSGCSGTPQTFTITVNPTPVATATPSAQTICSGPITTIALSSPVSGTTYSWTRDNTAGVTGIAASGSGNISGSLTNTTTAPVTVTFTITPSANGCAGTPVTATVLVNPIPDVVKPADQVLCNNESTAPINFTGTIPGTVFNWTNNNTSIGLASAGTGNIASFVATNTGTTPQVATITVTPSFGTINQTETFNYTGAMQTWTVPAGVTSITIDAYGAGGGTGASGSGSGGAGGMGSRSSGTLAVTPGQVLNIFVGGAGAVSTGGYNGGGAGGNASSGGGGGASDIRYPGITPGDRLIVAGGGGGGGRGGCESTSTINGGAGGNGDTNGANGTDAPTSGGVAGAGGGGISTGAGGAAGIGCGGFLGQPGQSGTATGDGGAGGGGQACCCFSINSIPGGGGGGGGYLGGGGGGGGSAGTVSCSGNDKGAGGGGAGGTSYTGGVTGGSVTTAVQAGNGFVVISYSVAGCTGTPQTSTITVNPTPVATATPSSQTICSGPITTIAITGPVSGTTFNWTRNNTAGVTGIAASGSGNISGSLINTTAAPLTVTFTITPTANGCTGTPITATVIVNPTPVATATPSSQTVCSGSITPINLTSTVTSTTYAWTRDNTVNVTGIAASGSGSSISGTLTNNTTVPQTVTFTITPTSPDGCPGTPITATVTVNAVPTITCPANIVVSNTVNQCGAAVIYTPTVTGIPVPTVTYTLTGATTGSGNGNASGTFFNIGTTTVSLTATNTCGTANCSFTVTVNDTQNPTITCPAPVTVSCVSAVPAVNTGSVTAADNCPGVVVTHRGDVISAQTCANRYTITRTYRATDASGNFVECTQIITVNDQTPPVMTCPAPITVSCASAVPAANIAAVTGVSDNCGGTVTVTHVGDVISAQTCANRYTITRTYRATDVCGNFAECTQIITVNDQTPPTLTCPAPVTVSCASAVPAPNIAAVTGVSDNCGGTVTVTHVGDVISAQTCANRYTITRTYRATDVCGNFAECTQIITVNDQTAPVITCPANITVTTPFGSCTAVVNFAATATDNCGGTITYAYSHAPGSAFPIGTTTVTATATDVCGNNASCTFTITVNDGQLPVITAQPVNRTVCAGTTATFSVTAVTAPNAGGPLSYQWEQWNGSSWVDVAGATSATLTLNSVTHSMNDNSYRVRVIGRCTTVISNFATLRVNPLPTISITVSPLTLLLPGQTTTLTAVTNQPGGTYVWLLNGQPTGATGSTLAGLTIDNIGAYSVRYTDPNGCVSTSAVINIGALQTELMWVYPNPNFGQFQVRVYSTSNTPFTVNVYDSKGARVFTRTASPTQAYTSIPIDLGMKAMGMYIVELRDNTGRKLGSKQVMVHIR